MSRDNVRVTVSPFPTNLILKILSIISLYGIGCIHPFNSIILFQIEMNGLIKLQVRFLNLHRYNSICAPFVCAPIVLRPKCLAPQLSAPQMSLDQHDIFANLSINYTTAGWIINRRLTEYLGFAKSESLRRTYVAVLPQATM